MKIIYLCYTYVYMKRENATLKLPINETILKFCTRNSMKNNIPSGMYKQTNEMCCFFIHFYPPSWIVRKSDVRPNQSNVTNAAKIIITIIDRIVMI